MIALTTRLNERNETIDQLHEEIESYEKVIRELEDGIDINAVMKAIGSNCGCGDLTCRDLIFVPIPHPISIHFQPTCKQTAMAHCKSAVQYLFHISWIKVPTKDDKKCRDLYNRIKIWATSCN